MVSTRRSPEEVAPAGRVAGLTVGACLLVSGLAFLVASWDELTCTPPGATCDDVAGIGGAVSLVALAVLLAVVAIVVMTARRPVLASGSSAWTWGLGKIFAIGVGLVAMRLPGHSCPDGVHLSPIFNTCVDGARRFDATSWVWPKRALFVAGVVAGMTVMRSPRRVLLTAPIAAVAWFAARAGCSATRCSRAYLGDRARTSRRPAFAFIAQDGRSEFDGPHRGDG